MKYRNKWPRGGTINYCLNYKNPKIRVEDKHRVSLIFVYKPQFTDDQERPTYSWVRGAKKLLGAPRLG